MTTTKPLSERIGIGAAVAEYELPPQWSERLRRIQDECRQLESQRDALLAACEQAREFWGTEDKWARLCVATILDQAIREAKGDTIYARAAIANATAKGTP